MRLVCNQIPSLPPLAWLAEYGSGGALQVRHGSMVETGADYFLEGVWNGDFAAGDFHATDCFFGTGGHLSGDAVLIISSAATNDFCYHADRGGRTLISNSLALLLAELGDELDPQNPSYATINNTMLRGINSYAASLPTKGGQVERLIYRNLRLSAAGSAILDKPMPPRFHHFEQYRDYLRENYRLMAQNARDPRRRHPMQIASTQSKGYDTTAINAIAAPFGLDQVFSIARGKAHGKFADQDEHDEVDDGGGDIGAVLGFECTFIERRAITTQLQSEHLYYAAVHASEDTNLAGINPHLQAPSLLLIGCLGEITAPWRYYHNYYGSEELRIADMERADHGGNALGEVRLCAGFITVPLFYLGARQRRDILDICDSAAMAPWRLNNNYDRPIARRIAEEAGVPRQHFGQKKNATAMVFTPPSLPLGQQLREEYIDFLDKAGVLARWKWTLLPLIHRLNRLSWFASPKQHRWLYYLQRLIGRLIGRPFAFPIIWQRLNSAFYSFCVNKRVGEYRPLLATAAAARAPVATQESTV